MREVRTGAWHWEAPHPDWKPGEEWDQMVSSYAIDHGDGLLLFDPLAPPRRLGAPLYVPPPDEGDPNPVEGQVFRAGCRSVSRLCR